MPKHRKNMLHRLAFHSGGKPRGWVRALVFNKDKTPRKTFHRIVFKKNGNVRKNFAQWLFVPDSAGGVESTAVASSNDSLMSSTTSTIQTLLNLKPLEHSVGQWRLKATPKIQLTADELTAKLNLITGQRLLISIGHDNYKVVPGGVQLCIQREQKFANAIGDRYLNLHPFQPLPRLAHLDETPDPWVDLILDGEEIGTVHMSDLNSAVAQKAEAGTSAIFIIHQLLGHSPEHVIELIKRSGNGRTIFWLHDFFSICVSHALQRNNLTFCKAPPVSSNACTLCVYGVERSEHVSRIKKLFDNVRIELISPSEATLEFWLAHSEIQPISHTVVPHLSLDWTPRKSDEIRSINTTARPRIGFLGTLAPHKGWPLFEQIASDPDLVKKFDFYVFTASRSAPKGMTHVTVKASAENPNAMADAVAEKALDLVLHWPSCHETFSLTTHEALIGGAYVVTNDISGNVAATINRLKKGTVLDSVEELLEFFVDGRAEALSQSARASRAQFEVHADSSQLSFSHIQNSEK